MTPWDHLARVLSLSPELHHAARCAGYALLLAGLGVFIWGMARFVELWRPPR